MGNSGVIIVYVIVMIAIFYFVGVKPQKKEQAKKQELMGRLSVGDYVLTTSGMYGKIIDITKDMVIVEFGGKNCRIPMLKAAISQIEKPDAIVNGVAGEDAKQAAAEAKSVEETK